MSLHHENAAVPIGIGAAHIGIVDQQTGQNIDPKELSSFQRILLTTDGTVTEILEAQYWEAIGVEKLCHQQIRTQTAIAALDLPPGSEIIKRQVLLKGINSATVHIFAESILIPSRLDPEIQSALANTQQPIGQLMNNKRMESFREILSCCRETAGDLAIHFDIEKTDFLFSRSYRVFANGRAIMLITEKFPERIRNEYTRSE